MRTAIAITLLTLFLFSIGAAQVGDADYGRELIEGRRCASCHATGAAPNLTMPRTGEFSPDALAATMWNHAPRMWEALQDVGRPLEGLGEGDIANIYAYYYSLRYFDPPGEAKRGRKVFDAKGCDSCHALKAGVGSDEPDGPPVERWSTMADPTLWLQSMWNHGGGMGDAMRSRGISWPMFSVQEMADLLAFVESQPAHSGLMPYLRVGDWAAGRRRFHNKGCANCHTLGQEAQGKIDLLDAARRQPLTSGLAVAMWNHRPEMRRAAELRYLELTPFDVDEMADVTAYLFRRGYFQVQGDAQEGRAVYESAGCAHCHEQGDSGAPALLQGPQPFNAISLASSVWMHGPGMKATMDFMGEEWPELTEKQVADLLAFVNSR